MQIKVKDEVDETIEEVIENAMLIWNAHALFRVHNLFIHDPACQKGSQAYQPEKLFSEWLTNFWLFWYQIHGQREQILLSLKTQKLPKFWTVKS